jgi:glycosyltransferase involved in cell wall biosynthesis
MYSLKYFFYFLTNNIDDFSYYLNDLYAMEILDMDPLVTIIITVYKRVEFLQEALESALAQTFECYEVIVTDDSDNDAAKAICNSVSNPTKVRYRSNQSRLGVALNLRAALLEAKGKYIAILNDDDYWEPDFLLRLVEPLEKEPSRILAFSDHWIILADGQIDLAETENNTKIFKRDLLFEGELRNISEIVLNKTVPLVQAAVFRKSALNPDLIDMRVSGAYDFWISCQLAKLGKPFYYIAERLTRYRTHQQMETLRPTFDKFEPEIFIYRTLLEKNYFPDWQKFIEQELGYMLYRSGRAKLEFDDIEQARQFFRESINLSPSWKAIGRFVITYLPKSLRVSLSFTLSN